MKPVRSVWRCLTFLILLCIANAALAAEAEPPPLKDTYLRQILFVLNPLQTPVTALQIVTYEKADPQVQEILELLGDAEGIRKVLAEDLTVGDQTKASQTEYTVESLLNNYLVATYPSSDEANAALERLARSSLILSATRNMHFELSTYYLDKNPSYPIAPDTKSGTYQWGMNGSSVMNFPAAWAKLTGFGLVGAVDLGIYWDGVPPGTHGDLVENFRSHFSRGAKTGQDEIVTGQFLALDSSAIGETGPDRGHGTHVSGLIAANPIGAIGMRGACPSCSLAMMRFAETADEDVGSQLIVELVRSGANVINLSWGSQAQDTPPNTRPPTYCSDPSYTNTLICLALTLAANRGVAVVAASGNRKAALQFPANQASVIAVGGLQRSGAGATEFWSAGYIPAGNACPNPGTGFVESGSNCSDSGDIGASKFQFVAPALDVLSTTYPGYTRNSLVHCGDRWDPTQPGTTGWYDYLAMGYGTCTGTSMSAPIVAGLVALMRSANPLMSPQDILAVLKRRSQGAVASLMLNMGGVFHLRATL